MTKEEIIRDLHYLASLLSAAVNGLPMPEKPVDVSWESVYSIAKKHSLANTVFSLVEPALRDEGAEDLRARWDKLCTVELLKHMKQTDEFKKITNILSENEISFLPIKGFLVKELYPRPHLRSMADIDIFVGDADMDKFGEIFKSLGYNKEDEPFGSVHDSYAKPPFMHIEVHKRLYSGSDYSFERASLKEGEKFWYLMTDADFFVFMLRHTRRHYENGGCGIRAVLDHYLYVKRNSELVSSSEFKARLESEGLLDFFNTLEAIAAYWFEGRDPGYDVSDFELYTVSGGTYGTFENNTYFSMKKRGKLGHVMSRMFPRPRIIFYRYKWVRMVPILLPIGYIARIVQSLFNGRLKECAELITEVDENKKLYNKKEGEK